MYVGNPCPHPTPPQNKTFIYMYDLINPMVDYRVYQQQNKAAIIIDQTARECVIGNGKINLNNFILEVQNKCCVSRQWTETTIKATCKKYGLELEQENDNKQQ